MKRTNN